MTSRMMAIATVNVLVLVVAAALVTRWQMRQEFGSFLLAAAGERVLTVSRALSTTLQSTPVDGRDALLEQLSSERHAAFMLVLNDGSHVAGAALPLPGDVRRRLAGPGRPLPPRAARAERPGAGPLFLVRSSGSPRYWVGVRMPIASPGVFPPPPGTLLIASNRFFTNPFFFDLWPWLGLVGAALLLSVACWMPWVLGLRRDIRRIEDATAQVAAGRFDVQVGVRRRDEVGRLADAVGEMAARLSALVTGQKRFLGDAAHELRSPLARMRVAVDLLEGEVSAPARRHIGDLHEDLDEMRQLTDALLALSRAELGSATSGASPVLVADAVDRAVRLEAPHADVRVDVPGALTVHAAPDHVARALRNVIRNAVFYAGDAGAIVISAVGRDGRAVLSIEDQGPGVPEDELDRLFVPFYRLDTSRDRHSGGAGLGLAIVRAAVEASGGTVSCRNRAPHGLVVTMTLPLAQG
jgi:two-component system sensor histidine kinase CpxA